MRTDRFVEARRQMVEKQLKARGIADARVLKTMREVPRHLFVGADMVDSAYRDEPLPIGEGQTISQPYIVAYMTEALALSGHERILELGTGSGYQTAVLAELAAEVFTVERIPSLSRRASRLLSTWGRGNIHFKIGDGHLGWEENAPYDGVIVTAAASDVPPRLSEQLKAGGRMVIPVGDTLQELFLLTRRRGKIEKKRLLAVRFVPLVKTRDVESE